MIETTSSVYKIVYNKSSDVALRSQSWIECLEEAPCLSTRIPSKASRVSVPTFVRMICCPDIHPETAVMTMHPSSSTTGELDYQKALHVNQPVAALSGGPIRPPPPVNPPPSHPQITAGSHMGSGKVRAHQQGHLPQQMPLRAPALPGMPMQLGGMVMPPGGPYMNMPRPSFPPNPMPYGLPGIPRTPPPRPP